MTDAGGAAGEVPAGALSVADASALTLADIAPLGTECVPLGLALGRVLARDVRSPLSLPPWDNASMDGYAVRAVDVAGATNERPVVLRVLEMLPAGSQPSRAVEPGAAVRIMTGAPIPPGADSVIRVEDTDRGNDRVAIRSARDAGRNRRPAGEDLRAGDVAIGAGTVLGPAQLGVLASVGAAEVEVYRVPRVAILATGDELVDLDRFDLVRAGARIVSSNSYTLRAAVAAAGGAPLDLGIAGDDRAALRERLREALHSGCDLVLTSGGVSAGELDFTREVLRELGAGMRVQRVRMRPGAPLGFGMLGAVPWLGLPGNPVSALVTFELFARPIIRRLRGEPRLFPRPMPVRVASDITLAAPLRHYLRVMIQPDADGALQARLTGPQGSGLLTSMARADALLVVPEERFAAPVRAGEQLQALPLGEHGLLAERFSG
ncbi:MAG TPA: gephyrin-like molybdotransferase Glp [Gemmatimonadaceae bacterium]|nr:gephyrin-like molybdotransferase Glp [Gemmatimonadaceae bacterium]